MKNSNALTGTLDVMGSETDSEKVTVSELVEALNSRGYGPMLIGPSILVLLPTGAIPGMPAICGLLILAISAQILMKKSHPWLPARIKNLSMKRKTLLSAIEKAKPWTKKIDKLIYPRFMFLLKPSLKPLTAIICIALACIMITLGFIPFLPMIPALGILLLGLGLTAKDGLLLTLSFLICAGSLISLPILLG